MMMVKTAKGNKVAWCCSLIVLTVLASGAVAAPDPEERIAEAQARLGQAQGVYDAAQEQLKAFKYGDFVVAGEKFLELRSGLVSKELGVLNQLSGLLRDPEVPAEVKQKAFAIVLPRMGRSPACWAGVSPYLKKLPLDGVEMFDLACRCAESAGGGGEETQLQLWDILRVCSADQPREQKRAMVERYLKICGEEGAAAPSPEQGLAQVLDWRAQDGDQAAGERLKALTERQAAGQAAVQKESSGIIALLEKGQWEAAESAVRGLKINPRRLNDDVCLQVASSKVFISLAIERRLALAAVMFAVMQGERSAARIYGQLSPADEMRYTPGYTGAAYFDMLDSYIVNRVSNPNWMSMMTGFFRPRANRFPPEIRHRLDECLAHGQEKLGLHDLLAQGLFQKAEMALDVNGDAALAALEAVMNTCPQSLESAKAEWLRDLLTGKGRIVQGPLPRVSDHFTAEYRPAFKLNGVFAEEPEAPLEKTMSIQACRVAAFDVEKLQTDGQPDTAVAAFDGKPDSFWTPGRSPAGLQVPFKSLVSINQVVIRSAGSPGYVVTLLDRDGRVLWQGERSLRLHDPSSPKAAPAPETVTMKILPVDNVAYLRVELTAATSNDGIAELSVKSPVYPGLQWALLPPRTVPVGARSVAAAWLSEGACVTNRLAGDQESIGGYPFSRWTKYPWKNSKKRNVFGEGGNLGVWFYGDKAALQLSGLGGIAWRLDDGRTGRIVKAATNAVEEFALAEDLGPGLHNLQIQSFGLPPVKDRYSPKDVVFSEVVVEGVPKACPVVRFESDGKWTSWFRLENGKSVSIPAKAGRSQMGIVFDQRAVLGMGAATIRNLEPKYDNAHGGEAPPWMQPGAPPSAFDAVAEALKARRLTVVYSKTGTVAEYQAARRLAGKAGVYCVSDDKQLNDYPGAMLAVGTVLNNRYNRQLLARANLFGNADFLNGGKAWCGAATDAPGDTNFFFICGPDAASVVAMVDEMAGRIPLWRGSDNGFRLFGASVLERVFAWDLGTAKPEAQAVKVTLGRNDRRSAQIGLAFDSEAKTVEATCSALVDPQGRSLAPARVRFVAFYEWIPFFGDLRLPDLLVDKPLLPIPANTATAIWLTFQTPANAAPGEYHGEIVVRVDKGTKRVPITVTVLPVTVPTGEDCTFYSYSHVPYWWHLGSETYTKALERLYRNEAEHRLSMVTVDPAAFTWRLVDGSNTFDFSQLMGEMALAEGVYKEAGQPPPPFFGSPDPRVPFMAILSGQNIKVDAESLGRISADFAVQLTAKLKETGRWSRYYQKVADEPGAKMEQWVASAKPYRDGGLKVTTAHAVVPQNALAAGVMSAWCPNYEHDLFDPFLRSRQKAGDPLWWYMCGVPSTRITGQLHDSLAFYWLTAKWNFDGAHSYGGSCMPSSGPEGSGMPFRFDHGLAFRMVFLPDGTLLDTTRREMESEGIIDCLLIKAAQKKIAGMRGDAAAEYGRRLEAILHAVVPYKRDYANAPAPWEKARAELYLLLAEIQ